MRKLFTQCALIALTLCATFTASADAQRRGGGGRGGRGGGGFRGGGGAVRAGGGGGGFRGGGFSGGVARSSARPSVTRGTVNRGNVSRNVTAVNRGNRTVVAGGRRVNTGDINIDRDWDGRYTGCCYYGRPVARAAAWGAAAATANAVYNNNTYYSVPSSGCTSTEVNGVTYVQCGNTWYRPQFNGSTTTYVKTSPP
jgi:hypothetical protein